MGKIFKGLFNKLSPLADFIFQVNPSLCLLNGQYHYVWNLKQKLNEKCTTVLHCNIVNQVLKVFLVKSYKIQVPVLLFVVLHQLLCQ